VSRYFFGSVTRVSDLQQHPFEVVPIGRPHWETGDYVLGRVISSPSQLSRAELPSGRMIELVQGDLMVGALGSRRATLEAVGDWTDIGDDGHFHAMTSAGLFGRVTSLAPLLPPLMRLTYVGHCLRNGSKVSLEDFVDKPPPGTGAESASFDIPTILVIGTSMSAGKTTTAKRIIRRLKELNVTVTGTKLTGAARYRDILAMQDAGADNIYDFVDVGLSSTICDAEEYRERLRMMLQMIQADRPDVLVAEAGASPLEPYNGEVVLQELRGAVRCTVLCASDPYAVAGVILGFGYEPDLVAGIATNTTSGVDLIKKLTGQTAFSFLRHDPSAEGFAVIRQRLGI
jgi:hypothetical protein